MIFDKTRIVSYPKKTTFALYVQIFGRSCNMQMRYSKKITRFAIFATLKCWSCIYRNFNSLILVFYTRKI